MHLPTLLYLLTPIASLVSGEDGIPIEPGIGYPELHSDDGKPSDLTALNERKNSLSVQQDMGAKKDYVVRLDSASDDGNDIMTETTTTAGGHAVDEKEKIRESRVSSAVLKSFDESLRSRRSEVTETNTTEETTIFSHLPPNPTQPPTVQEEGKKDTVTDIMKSKGKAEAALVPILKLSKATSETGNDDAKRSAVLEVRRKTKPRQSTGITPAHMKSAESQLRHAIAERVESDFSDGDGVVGTESAVVNPGTARNNDARPDSADGDLMSMAEREKRSDMFSEDDLPVKPNGHTSNIQHRITKSKVPHRRASPKGHRVNHAHAPPLADAHTSELSAHEDSAKYQVDKRKRSSAGKTKEDEAAKRNNDDKPSLPDTKQELRSIFSSIQQSHHHKLTRSVIRQLAKKAIMLATLKHAHKLTDVTAKAAVKKDDTVKNMPSHSSKKSHTALHVRKTAGERHTPRAEKAKHKSEVQRAHHKPESSSTRSMIQKDTDLKREDVIPDNNRAEKMGEDFSISQLDANKKDSFSPSEVTLTESKGEQSRIDASAASSEFSEDVNKQNGKMSSSVMVTDDAMSSSTKKIPDLDDAKAKDQKAGALEESAKMTSVVETAKVSTSSATASNVKEIIPSAVTKPNSSLVDIFEDSESKKTPEKTEGRNAAPQPTSKSEPVLAKKSEVPSIDNAEKIRSLKSALSKANPDKVPLKFLPDLPAGLRMIAWNELLKKKAKQLSDLEAQADLLGIENSAGEKPLTINIDIDPQAAKEGAKETEDLKLLTDDVTYENADKKDKTLSDDSENIFGTANNHRKISRHVTYLQKHITGARSLRKLIAKTLIGHCKSTGKRILEAFVAMDKALERAQAIASVIGRKFHVDPERIDNLVGEKEDEVVETFLRDIFTKLGGKEYDA